MDFRHELEAFAEAPLHLDMVLHLLKDYKRPLDKINELVKQQILVPVKKGLYMPGPKTKIIPPEPFLVANHLWGPSYISLDSALSYWGYIPERVYEVSSVTIKSTKTYQSPDTRYTYYHTSLPYYTFGIKHFALTPKQFVLIAGPEKAICDKIILTSGVHLRSERQTTAYLIDDLRMDRDMLKNLDHKEILSWTDASQKKSSLIMLVKTLQKL